MPKLKLFLLGPPRVEFDGAPVDLQRRKALALLIYLAISGQPHSRDALATLFWPDYSQSQARAYLRRDLAVLNTSLAGEWLAADREIVELKHTSELWLDVAEFERLLAACRSHDHPPEAICADCLPFLTEAATLYTNDFLVGFTLRDSPEFDDWQFFQAESLRRELASALERLVCGLNAQGNYETAIPHARRWLALDPLHEPAQRQLIQVYDLAGQPAAALRQYEEYVKLLDEELGLPPEEETTTLYEAIKAKRMLEPYLKKARMKGRQKAKVREVEPAPAPLPPGHPIPSSPASLQAPAAQAMGQEIRFCLAPDGVRIAFATLGEGPVLVKASNWLTHLEYDWESPVWRHWLTGLSQHHTLVRYDRRGCGLSDWDANDFSLRAYVEDLETVVDTLGLERFPLLGLSGGGPVAIAYAARHPEKVSHLILYGSYVRGRLKRSQNPEQLEEAQIMLKMMEVGWGKPTPAFRQVYTSLFIPEGTAEQINWFNDLQRISTSPEVAVRMFSASYATDVSELARQVTTPTLVLHAREDAVTPFEEGRQLAALIPGARFVPLDGKNHILLEAEPAWSRFLAEVHQFVQTEFAQPINRTARKTAPSPSRVSNSTAGRKPGDPG